MSGDEKVEQARKWEYACWECGVVGTGDCPDEGSSDCPLTMDEERDCMQTVEELRSILSFR